MKSETGDAHVNPVDAGERVPETREELAVKISEAFEAAGERLKIESGIRDAVAQCQRDLTEALEVRNAYLRFRVQAEGASVASAARAVGISRQMARRILGEVDSDTVEGIKDGFRRLRGAAFASWLRRMDPETRDLLLDAWREGH